MSESKSPMLFDFERGLEATTDQVRAMLSGVEAHMRSLPDSIPGESLPLKFYKAPGIFARELTLPAGHYVMGKILKFATMTMIVSGEVSIFSQDGVKRVKGPYTFTSTPGAKRLAYAHTDVVWTVFHPTEETDPEIVEAMFVAKSYDEVPEQDAPSAVIQLEGN